MKAYEFTIDKPLEYVCTGKFEALSPNWIHETADLTDYELFVISKGPLRSEERRVGKECRSRWSPYH